MSDEQSVVTVRPATRADVAGIDAVVVESFTPYVARIGVQPVPMLFDYPAFVSESRVWVAVDDDGVCGLLVLSDESDHVMLDVIAVADRVRGTGVGAALMDHTEQYAATLGRPEIRLYTHVLMVENRAYYARHGYREVGVDVFDEHRRRVTFSKRVGIC